MTKLLNLYLVNQPINSYLEAIEALESQDKLIPLEQVKSFNLHIRGNASAATSDMGIGPSQAKIVRELGARPAVRVITGDLFTSVRLISSCPASIIGTLQLSQDLPEDMMICALSECDIIAVDVDIDEAQESFDESIPVQGMKTFPWVRISDVIEDK